MDNCDFDFSTEEIVALCRRFDVRLALFSSVVGDDSNPDTMTPSACLPTNTPGDREEE